MAAITAGVFFPHACVLHLRHALGPPSHRGPSTALAPWPPCGGPGGEGRRSGDLHPTGAIADQRTNAVAVPRARWRTVPWPPELHRTLDRTGCRRRQPRLAPAALAAPATAAAGYEDCRRSTNISRRRSGGRSGLVRPTA